MDKQALLRLWNLEDMPACEKGMEFARKFLIRAGEGVDKLGTEEPEQRIKLVTEAYTEMVNHGIDCDDCKET